ncbi:MAG: hypothetical protein ACI80V_002492 [Rhodothermales bacterium]|jgi:hypothetical protein
MLRRTVSVFAFVLAAIAVVVGIGRAQETPGLEDAATFMDAAFADICARDHGPDAPTGDAVYEINYRNSWQDESEPDEVFKLFRMSCYMAAYNSGQIYLTRGWDAGFEILSFAEPAVTYDYADEKEATLRSLPVVKGFSATTTMTNSNFDPETNTLTTFVKWRGLGDAWSAGTWSFDEGRFILTRFVVDPTWSANLDPLPDGEIDLESFEVFPQVRVQPESNQAIR